MLYVIMMSGMFYYQNLTDTKYPDTYCLQVAEELRKSDKVSDAFCLIEDESNGKQKIGRRKSDGTNPN